MNLQSVLVTPRPTFSGTAPKTRAGLLAAPTQLPPSAHGWRRHRPCVGCAGGCSLARASAPARDFRSHTLSSLERVLSVEGWALFTVFSCALCNVTVTRPCHLYYLARPLPITPLREMARHEAVTASAAKALSFFSPSNFLSPVHEKTPPLWPVLFSAPVAYAQCPRLASGCDTQTKPPAETHTNESVD